MVLLTMTPAVAAAVEIYTNSDDFKQNDDEPNLAEPAPGKPISHGQLIDILKHLKAHPDLIREKGDITVPVPIRLAELLKGCKIYTPPPKPKAEPVCFGRSQL
jgi:TMEM199 family protein